MLQVLAECGRLDTGLMSRLLDKPEPEVIGQLVAADLIYKEPNSQQYQTADEYLSGNVRQKLKDAQGATLLDPAYERNVKALEAVQPEIVPFIDIDVRLGRPGFPPRCTSRFSTGIWPSNAQHPATAHRPSPETSMVAGASIFRPATTHSS